MIFHFSLSFFRVVSVFCSGRASEGQKELSVSYSAWSQVLESRKQCLKQAGMPVPPGSERCVARRSRYLPCARGNVPRADAVGTVWRRPGGWCHRSREATCKLPSVRSTCRCSLLRGSSLGAGSVAGPRGAAPAPAPAAAAAAGPRRRAGVREPARAPRGGDRVARWIPSRSHHHPPRTAPAFREVAGHVSNPGAL